MTTDNSRAAVRVCAIADIQCSRGCGTGACKREGVTENSRADALTGMQRAQIEQALRNAKYGPGLLEVVVSILEDVLAASPVEQPVAAASSTQRFAVNDAVQVLEQNWEFATAERLRDAFPVKRQADYTGVRDDSDSVTQSSQPAAAPIARNDPAAVTRLKAICRKLGLESAFPDEVYSNPEGLFAIFGQIRSAIDRLTRSAPSPIVLHALRAAKQFIANGVELGYIRMPDSDCPDPAHEVPNLIDAAISSLSTAPSPADERAVGWFDKERNTIRWRDGLVNADFCDGQPFYTQPAQEGARVGLTDEARATIMDACQSISRSADALKECHTVDGDWGDDLDAKAFHDAELQLLARLTALLDQPGRRVPRAEVTEWQPIETVPKDGTEVVLLFADEVTLLGKTRPRVRAAAWLVDWTIPYLRDNPPTHWMPLPAAPFDAARAGEAS
ncbi:DUF551 domain-containing protein [Burkholderia vietnamiensis]|uniref:DUF551 domain-containing protein n=1 Tax=Burkholderia vietnamiensis TaxID=60552 RepID=UPI001FCA048D|nr:DUF551 domain-containing protein [Burkholderia vietnamiensis]